jgi:hypothetical protein
MGSVNPQGGTQGGANIVGGGVGEGPGPEVMAGATLDGTKVGRRTCGKDFGHHARCP